MEEGARTAPAKLPKLKISPFNGTVADWVRFENMFVTQVDAKQISDEEKFGYLLEMVNGKVGKKFQISSQAQPVTHLRGTPQKGIWSNKLVGKRPY